MVPPLFIALFSQFIHPLFNKVAPLFSRKSPHFFLESRPTFFLQSRPTFLTKSPHFFTKSPHFFLQSRPTFFYKVAPLFYRKPLHFFEHKVVPIFGKPHARTVAVMSRVVSGYVNSKSLAQSKKYGVCLSCFLCLNMFSYSSYAKL